MAPPHLTLYTDIRTLLSEMAVFARLGHPVRVHAFETHALDRPESTFGWVVRLVDPDRPCDLCGEARAWEFAITKSDYERTEEGLPGFSRDLCKDMRGRAEIANLVERRSLTLD